MHSSLFDGRGYAEHQFGLHDLLVCTKITVSVHPSVRPSIHLLAVRETAHKTFD